MLTEKRFETGELSLNVAEGPPNGPPVVLLHGVARWWRDWQAVADLLEPRWQVLAVDLHGHGHSGRGEHYTADDYARDIAALLTRGIDRPAVVVGYSLGALVALTLTAKVPERIRALIVMDPPLALRSPNAPNADNAVVQSFRQILAMAPTYEALLNVLMQAQPNAPVEHREEFARVLSLLAPEVLDAVINAPLVDSAAYTDALTHITVPTLLIRADPSAGGIVPDEELAFAREHIPNLQTVEVAGAAHHQLLEAQYAPQTLDAIQSFLAAL